MSILFQSTLKVQTYLFELRQPSEPSPMSQESSTNTTNIFSSNGESVISRPLDLDEQHARAGIQNRPVDGAPIEEYYEIDRTATQIKEHNFKRVGYIGI